MASLDKVLSDYKKFVSNVKEYSQDKVEQTVSSISNKTNAEYASDSVDQRVQLFGKATNFKVSETKDRIDGVAYANESKELIYLEFGTRQTHRDTLRIRTNFESGLDTLSIAAPYKINAPFYHQVPIVGRYYFLSNIDEEGVKFIKTFGK